ncbi:hypothetical protein BHYA_0053g00040 [Botrytis hyacinthi]|uniref:Uncharacterized protein n=1 Tax=Botrytis hyacinthi TaxID=278943 RepID=A0A4Z1GWL6_9HELO|nr:hypothetical protein BHYA_0053g00040 [Botrytis hyacinthi]
MICNGVLHLATASKPSIKTVTVNPCTLTPTIPTYISTSSPCPTITISTSHTSCPPFPAPVPTPYQPPPSTPHVPPPVRKLVTSDIKSTMKHPVPPQSTLQPPSPYPRVAQHSVPVLTILPTQLIAIRPVQFIPPPLPQASPLKPSPLQPPTSSPAPVPTIPPTPQTASSPVPSTPPPPSSPSRQLSLQLQLQLRVAKVSRSRKEIRVRRLWGVRVRVLM